MVVSNLAFAVDGDGFGPPRLSAVGAARGMRPAPPLAAFSSAAAQPGPVLGSEVFAVAGLALGALAARARRRDGRRRAGRRRDGASTAAASGRDVAPTAAASGATTTSFPQIDRSTTKQFRKDFMRSESYFKFSKTQMESAMEDLKRMSGSDLLAEIRANGFRKTYGDITLVLAEAYGFCWGVERAGAMAMESRRFFPDKTIWASNEIIHNPQMNRNLLDLGVRFIKAGPNGEPDFSAVVAGDVVILPAFGASVDVMALLQKRDVQIVDTTCPWVSKVWNSVERSKDKGHTTIIHGKFNHEETIATKSFADKYIVVAGLREAEYVARYILVGGDREEFMAKFADAMSAGFDPDVDLEGVGVANQTTMMKGETELIGKLLERTMIKKFGPQNLNDHYIAFNTICDATHERQDAMYKMLDGEYEAPSSNLYATLESEQADLGPLKSEKFAGRLSSKKMEDQSRGVGVVTSDASQMAVDMCLVVGGFNSSNTTHLLEIAEERGVPTYHIDRPERIGDANGNVVNRIQHKPLSTPPISAMLDQGLEVQDSFLPDGPVVIGITSGASTPDSVVGESLCRILQLRGLVR